MMKSSNNILIDARSLYWAATKRVGPKNRDDIFYTGFAVSLLTVTQLALAVFAIGTLGSSIIDQLSSAFVTALILVLAASLAILNSLIIFSIDKKISSQNRCSEAFGGFGNHCRLFCVGHHLHNQDFRLEGIKVTIAPVGMERPLSTHNGHDRPIADSSGLGIVAI